MFISGLFKQTSHNISRTSIRLTMLVAVTSALILTATINGSAMGAAGQELVGIVQLAPVSSDGYGQWELVVDGGQIWQLTAQPAVSYFLSTIPHTQDRVYVALEVTGLHRGTIITMMGFTRVVTTVPVQQGELTHIQRQGSILSKPTASDGIGQWQLYSQGIVYDVDVYSSAAFVNGIPDRGGDVAVSGWKQASRSISADVVEIDDGTIPRRNIERDVAQLSGQVIGTPIDTATGQRWQIRDNATLYIVDSDQDTVYSPQVPEAGMYVDLLVVSQNADEPPLAIVINISTHTVGELVVRLQPDAEVTSFAETYRLLVRETVLPSLNIHRLSALNPMTLYLEHLREKLQEDPTVLWSELNYTGELPVDGHPHRTWGWGGADDSSYINQAAFSQINIGNVHESYRGNAQIVAIIDTGVDLRHPKLQANLMQGVDLIEDDVIPQDKGPGSAQGHGTHISGIVLRVAPESQILPIRVLDPDGRGDVFTAASAVEWAVHHDADVINLSLGTLEDSRVLHDVIHWATEEGVAVVAAAGNDNTSVLHYPAAYTETLAVTAVDAAIAKADFANYGPWVALAAPGVAITSTIVTAQGSGYASWSGTSMAAPFVSGTMALLHEKYPTMPVPEMYARLVSRGQIIHLVYAQDKEQVSSFLNVERSLQDALPPPIYLPIILVAKVPTSD